MILTPEPLNMV